jgi:hypothetical protein
MKQQFYPPRLNYLVFELIKIDTAKYRTNPNDSSAFTQEDVIYLAVKPDSINYQIQKRNYVLQSLNSTFITKYSYQPERCSLGGVFGHERRYVYGSYMTGWERLRQFTDNIINKSNEIDSGKSLYFINYYDFNFQKYSVIDINSWSLNGNASTHSIMPRYSLDFILLGELITPLTNKDSLLNMLVKMYLPGGQISNQLESLSFTLPEWILKPLADAESMYLAYQTMSEIYDMGKGIYDVIDNIVLHIRDKW